MNILNEAFEFLTGVGAVTSQEDFSSRFQNSESRVMPCVGLRSVCWDLGFPRMATTYESYGGQKSSAAEATLNHLAESGFWPIQQSCRHLRTDVNETFGKPTN